MMSDSGSGDGEAPESGTPGDKDDTSATVSPAPSSAVATDGGESGWDSAATASAVISDSGSGDEEMSGSGMREDKDSTTTARSVTVTQSSSSTTDAEGSSSDSTTAISAMVTGDEEISGFGTENEYHAENPGSDSTATMSTSSPDPKSENGRKVQEPTDGVQLNKPSGRSLVNGPQGRVELLNPEPDQHKGHSTPGWIIIVGFVVGVAILVTLCIAIATRDKWNGPRQASQPETKTNSSNQQREVEMETFIHEEEPRENGKTAEYTVISLDELPENYSSH
ncbi:osteocalcin 2-like [Brachyistius frenatus]|uniref:osteocalcin 2-like n=1 Tax=Brachyistius frenatus TaxID=100188 RepID=UPI0037E81385